MSERRSGRRLILVDDDLDFNMDMLSVLGGEYDVEAYGDPRKAIVASATPGPTPFCWTSITVPAEKIWGSSFWK